MAELPTDAQAKFYDTFWAARPAGINVHEACRLSKILSAMVTVVEKTGTKKLRICELGCGTGWLSNELRVFGDVSGVDFSEEAIKIAKSLWPKIDFEVSDIVRYRPAKTFDLVVSSEVIEHINDKTAFMDAVIKLLDDDGFLIITCPNGKVKRYCESHDLEIQPAEEWLSPKELRSLVGAYLSVEKHETFLLNFSNKGVLRIINSYKLNKLVQALGCSEIYAAICASLGYGLYQIIIAQNRR